MNDHPSTCSTEPHLHTALGPILVGPGMPLLVVDHDIEAVIPNRILADRIVQLLQRHGLTDMVDDLAPSWSPPWAPPNGTPA